MNITKDITYVGVNDRDIDLFEGQYTVENGMAYNSYVLTDEKTGFSIRLTHVSATNGSAMLSAPLAAERPTTLSYSIWSLTTPQTSTSF